MKEPFHPLQGADVGLNAWESPDNIITWIWGRLGCALDAPNPRHAMLKKPQQENRGLGLFSKKWQGGEPCSRSSFPCTSVEGRPGAFCICPISICPHLHPPICIPPSASPICPISIFPHAPHLHLPICILPTCPICTPPSASSVTLTSASRAGHDWQVDGKDTPRSGAPHSSLGAGEQSPVRSAKSSRPHHATLPARAMAKCFVPCPMRLLQQSSTTMPTHEQRNGGRKKFPAEGEL